MVPKDMNTDVGNNSAWEMWVGREFPDHEKFWKTLAKFTIYGNFTLKHLKTTQIKVTTCCRDQNCPWHIHASIVESGPQFKVMMYNPNDSYSRPTMGMAHRPASAALIAEFITDSTFETNGDHERLPNGIWLNYQLQEGTYSERDGSTYSVRIVREVLSDTTSLLH